jgi:predicted GH43/DUF377 family glycosyl hydrolase
MPVTVKRKNVRLDPTPLRVIARFYLPGGSDRAFLIIEKVLELTEENVNLTLNHVLSNFSKRHRNISKIFENNFNRVKQVFDELNIESFPAPLKKKIQKLKIQLLKLSTAYTSGLKRKLLIGSYFTMEYSIESTAFFNPSIVEHPDQTDLREEGQKRVIVSFRATGEGHISSLVFRDGIIDKDNNLHFKSISRLVDKPEVVKRHVYNKKAFLKKLYEMNIYKDAVGKGKEFAIKLIKEAIELVMDKLGDNFLYGELRASIEEAVKDSDLTVNEKGVIEAINWLASSHYEIEFSLDTDISERVIFPISYTERNGIEDARFVKFTEENGSVTYYATYTAFNGYTILPKFIQTKDFYHFKVMPLNGIYAQNKGMALFPRRIKGKYVMISRYDGVNNYIMYSDNINLWQNAQKIEPPMYPWEFIKTGNSGSPIETDQGWLLLTHGVGPMRRYCIGAVLLDLEDPTKVIGHLKDPLLVPNEEEREGYVPNVVYSCGSILHNNELILPYGISDTSSTFAVIPLDDLLDELLESVPGTRKSALRDKRTASILFVDDDPVMRKMVAEILREEGYHVEVAEDGIDALIPLGRNKYDLLLLDINMPKMDGYQLLEKIKEENILTPVMFLTARDSEEDEIKGLKLGAVEYIRKPFSTHILLLKIKGLLKNSKN